MKINREKYELCLARACTTTREVAENIGVSRNLIDRVVAGRTATPATVGKIARGLGVDVTEIMEEK